MLRGPWGLPPELGNLGWGSAVSAMASGVLEVADSVPDFGLVLDLVVSAARSEGLGKPGALEGLEEPSKLLAEVVVADTFVVDVDAELEARVD